MHKYIDRALIGLVLATAAFMRFYHFGQIPFMHDEFSAIFRTQYSNIHDLIAYGVKPDSHPPGVQVFLYYWIRWFGLSETSLKWPFALLGVGSVWLMYRVAESWFNKTTALFTAAFLSVIQYTIFYSQLARPYGPGLFFTLLSVLFWTKIVFKHDERFSTFLWFVLASATNAYIHAFTLFFLLVQLATGLIFLKGKLLWKYLAASVTIGVLFLPNLSIFLLQLSRGDIGGWLNKPSPYFIFHYFSYVFQFSTGFAIITLGLALLLTIRHLNTDKQKNTFRLIALAWFLTTYLTAYFYSIFRTPIIQISTLYFVFPFIIMLLFSFIKELTWQVRFTAVLIIMLTGTSALVLGRNYYKEMYRQGFDQIPKNCIADLKNNHKIKTVVVLQTSNTKMFDYYFKKYGIRPQYFDYEKQGKPRILLRWLDSLKAKRVLFGCADYAPLFVLENLKDYFPFIENQKAWFNAEYYVLSKIKQNHSKNACTTRKIIARKIFRTKKNSYFLIGKKQRYSRAIEIGIDSLSLGKYDVLNVRATFANNTAPGNALLVFDIRKPNGKVAYWAAKALGDFYFRSTTGLYSVYISKRINSLGKIPKHSLLKVYVWKRDSSVLWLSSMEVYLTTINPVEIGLFDVLP